jgi:alpha,alpha-trehalase
LKLKLPEPELVNTFFYIHDYWPELTVDGSMLALPLPNQWIRPGGFFKMFFYWDSYFTSLGLIVQGKQKLALGMLENFFYLIDKIGFVPNYVGKKVCDSRSRPPFLTSFVKDIFIFNRDKNWLKNAIKYIEKEYFNYWVNFPHLDSSGLSRYIDLGGGGCTTHPDTPHYRGIGESGWDNTPRFGEDITHILPIDLNCLLYQYEVDLSSFYKILDEMDNTTKWLDLSNRRKDLINEYCWDKNTGFYYDYNLEKDNFSIDLPRTLASFFPLWAGLANQEQAELLVKKLALFETEYGLSTCEPGWDDNTQWNYPVGWAPLHWIVIYGLRKYDFHEEAKRISMKWLRLNAKKYTQTKVLREKYNVVEPDGLLPGRYGPQRGFGWTNGVYAAILVKIIFGREYDLFTGEQIWSPIYPDSWSEEEILMILPN